MQVSGINGQIISASRRMRPGARDAAAGEAPKAGDSKSVGRALIPLSPARSSEGVQTVARQPANFLAHLIATEQALPQTRERRRAEPDFAAAIYVAAREAAPVEASHALVRAI